MTSLNIKAIIFPQLNVSVGPGSLVGVSTKRKTKAPPPYFILYFFWRQPTGTAAVFFFTKEPYPRLLNAYVSLILVSNIFWFETSILYPGSIAFPSVIINSDKLQISRRDIKGDSS